jgi:hypothetical protein
MVTYHVHIYDPLTRQHSSLMGDEDAVRVRGTRGEARIAVSRGAAYAAGYRTGAGQVVYAAQVYDGPRGGDYVLVADLSALMFAYAADWQRGYGDGQNNRRAGDALLDPAMPSRFAEA